MSVDNSAVVIENVELIRQPEYQELSAIVDGDKIWYRFPLDIDLEVRVEAFIAPAMFEGMVSGNPVVVKDNIPVSPMLLDELGKIQSIFKCWNPDLNIIKLVANRKEANNQLKGSVCCFSGGVDSMYSYASHADKITHLLLVQGFDNWKSESDWKESVKARSEFAESCGKKLIAIDTNVRDFVEKRKIYWGLEIGSILAGIGVTIAPEKFFIPSSWTYQDLHAYGSHPLVDPLWSTELTHVIHDGADTTRSEKIEFISNSQYFLDQLQVCWKSTARNCGDCPKCVRTSLVLNLIGKTSKSLPSVSLPNQLKQLRIDGESSLPYVNDLIAYSQKQGDADIYKRLTRMRKNFIMRNALDEFLKAMLGSWGRELDKRLHPHEWRQYRGGLRSTKKYY